MANTTTQTTLFEHSKKLVRVIQVDYVDTAAATDVVVADASAFTGPDTVNPVDYFSIIKVEYDISEGGSALVEFNATTDSPALSLSGQGEYCFEDEGGFVDPKASGYNGDIQISYAGLGAGDHVWIKFTLKKKQN